MSPDRTPHVAVGRRARWETKLAEDVREVPVNGVLAEEELLCDHRVAQSPGDEPQDLQLRPR